MICKTIFYNQDEYKKEKPDDIHVFKTLEWNKYQYNNLPTQEIESLENENKPTYKLEHLENKSKTNTNDNLTKEKILIVKEVVKEINEKNNLKDSTPVNSETEKTKEFLNLKNSWNFKEKVKSEFNDDITVSLDLNKNINDGFNFLKNDINLNGNKKNEDVNKIDKGNVERNNMRNKFECCCFRNDNLKKFEDLLFKLEKIVNNKNIFNFQHNCENQTDKKINTLEQKMLILKIIKQYEKRKEAIDLIKEARNFIKDDNFKTKVYNEPVNDYYNQYFKTIKRVAKSLKI